MIVGMPDRFTGNARRSTIHAGEWRIRSHEAKALKLAACGDGMLRLGSLAGRLHRHGES